MSDLSTLCLKYNYDVQNFLTLDNAGYCISLAHAAPKIKCNYLVSSESYWIAIYQLWKVGCNLDFQDHKGILKLFSLNFEH